MVKYAFLIIPDTHFGNNKPRVRKNMNRERKQVEMQIMSLIDKYIETGHKVVLLFLGDIFHSGIDSPGVHTYYNNLFIKYKSKCLDIFVVVGNHELSYKKNNPFYSLFSNVESNRVLFSDKTPLIPEGMANTVRIVDSVSCGNVTFFFNHYNARPIMVDSKNGNEINIGLFHSAYVCKSVLSDMKREFDLDNYVQELTEFDDESGEFFGYDYSFFGHLHSVFGMYRLGRTKKTILYYLASLVRTKESEVLDTFLKRDIPAVLIEDDKFVKIENNFFNLLSRGECVDENKVSEQRIKYESIKKVRDIRYFRSIERNPVDKVKQKCSMDPYISYVLDELIINGDCPIRNSVISKLAKEGIYV